MAQGLPSSSRLSSVRALPGVQPVVHRGRWGARVRARCARRRRGWRRSWILRRGVRHPRRVGWSGRTGRTGLVKKKLAVVRVD